MASADYSVGTKVTADVSNFEKGMNKAEKSLKGFSDKLANSIDRLGKKGLIGSMANVTLAVGGLTKSFNTVIKFAKDVGKAINECTEAYKGQIIAERALDTAIQNNPFITGASSKALKQFASDMQKVTNYGDEQLIPMMTNLVSLGRTESETMQIMSVAMDMSAGMGISLDTAITQLNATLNGNIGRLGQQNAELKGLTEEELRSGRAIEILGEKFKGLSSATADTSKQLQNIKGDFKEALGQFTLPSSDLWNKFWSGFYQRGIEAINKINAFMDSQIIGKKLANAITEQIARINPADVGGRIDYTRSVLKVIGDEELEALKNYLSGLRTLSAEQEIILKRIKAEEDSRYQSSINAKKEAEDKKKQADAEAQITAEMQKQNEIASKKTDWSSRLLDQRIEMLETERDRAMQYAEEEGQETYTIWRDYNNKILELKLERLEKEKEKALAEEGLTAEDKIKIEEYYSGEIKKIYQDLGNYKRKKKEEEKKEEINYLKVVFEETKKYLNKTAEAIKKFAEIAKKVVKAIFDTVSKLVKFSISDSLDKILEFEDAILTFFVETLPQLPQFISSILQSVSVLINNLFSKVDGKQLVEVMNNIVKTLVSELPNIIANIASIAVTIIKALASAFTGNIDSILNALSRMLTTIIESIGEILQTLIPVVVQAIVGFIGVILKNLPSIIKVIIEAIPTLVTSILEAIPKFFEEDFPTIIAEFIKLIPTLVKVMVQITVELIKHLPEIVVSIIAGLIKAFAETDWIQVVKDIFTAFIDGIKSFFGIHSPSTVFAEMGGNMIKGLWEGMKNLGGWLWDNLKNFFTGIVDGIKDVFSNVGSWLKDTFSNAWEGIKNAWSGAKDFFSGVASGIKGAFENIGSWFKSTFENMKTGLTSFFHNMGEGMKSAGEGAWDKLSSFGFKVSDAVSNFKENVKEGVSNAWEKTKDVASNVASAVSKGVSSAVSTVKNVLGKLKFWASGTNSAPRGLAVVGEAGPELVRFRGGEQVLNARNTQKTLEGMGGTTINQNVTFNNLQDTTAFAMIQQFKQYNRQMAINGVL